MLTRNNIIQTYVIPKIQQQGYLQGTIFTQDEPPSRIAIRFLQLMNELISRCFEIA